MRSFSTWLTCISCSVLFLCLSSGAQDLPDAPSATPQGYGEVSARPQLSFIPPPAVTTRHPKRLIALVGAIGFEQVCAVYDARQTEKGLKAGVAVEGNTWLVGQHPSFRALESRDILYTSFLVTPSVLSYVFHNTPFFFGGLAAPVTYGIKHIQGGKQWQTLLDERK
jgi:hypothetical protein